MSGLRRQCGHNLDLCGAMTGASAEAHGAFLVRCHELGHISSLCGSLQTVHNDF